MLYTLRYASPIGLLVVTANEKAVLTLRPGTGAPVCEESPVLQAAKAWLDAYFAGARPEMCLSLDPQGSEYSRRVWRRLLEIPYGETVSYGTLARELGTGARALGGAVGRNPVSLLIPCHRVIRADGSITGYAWGLERKRFLLELEGALPPEAAKALTQPPYPLRAKTPLSFR